MLFVKDEVINAYLKTCMMDELKELQAIAEQTEMAETDVVKILEKRSILSAEADESEVKNSSKKRKKKNPKRYLGSPADMLTGLDVLLLNMIAVQPILVKERVNWDLPLFTGVQLQVTNAGILMFGTDYRSELKDKTHTVRTGYQKALELFKDFITQIDHDFRKEPELLEAMRNRLGINEYYDKAKSGNQVMMNTLLIRFAENIAPYKPVIVEMGLNSELITELLGLNGTIHEGNVAQEGHKSMSKTITKDKHAICNDLYKEVMGMVRISKRILRKLDPKAELSQFSYSRIVKNLHRAKPDIGDQGMNNKE